MENKLAIVEGLRVPELDFNLFQFGAGVIIAVVITAVLFFVINGVRTRQRFKHQDHYSKRPPRPVTNCGRTGVKEQEVK